MNSQLRERYESRQLHHVWHPYLAAIVGRAEWDSQTYGMQSGDERITLGVEGIVVWNHLI